MQTLEKRITALEQANPIEEGPIFVHVVGFDGTDKEIERITKGDQVWQRQQDESINDFKDRATQEATPPLPRCRTVFVCF